MKKAKLLQKISNNPKNISFREFCSLLEAFGFSLNRTAGSHHIFAHPEIPELVNVQDAKGEAKPYQIKQALKLVEKYNLKLKE